MDTLDRLILSELGVRCRVSFTDLASKFNVSLNTIKSRVDQLVQERVILAFDVQLKLELFNANHAIFFLDIEKNTTQEDLRSLGDNPFIAAMGLGFELNGFAVSIYRTNNELNQAVNHLRESEHVKDVRVLPFLAPPSVGTEGPSKGIDALKKVDWKILKSLRRDGRKSLGDIASDVGASVPTVRKRLKFLRSNGLITETILINPAAIESGLVVMVRVRIPDLTSERSYLNDRILREKIPESYWISWTLADRSEVILTFVAASMKDVAQLRAKLLEVLESVEILSQIVVPEWVYFLDFRDDIIEEHLTS